MALCARRRLAGGGARRRRARRAPAARASSCSRSRRGCSPPAGCAGRDSIWSPSASARAATPACGSALATARGIARAYGARLVGVGIAARARRAAARSRRVAVLDARRGEAFVAAYRDGDELLAPRVCAPAELGSLAPARRAARWRSATARYAFAPCSRRPASRSRGGAARCHRRQRGRDLPARRGRRRRRGAARLSARPGCRARAGRAPAMNDSPTPRDPHPAATATCPQVAAIERRAFPTPWSIAMFVLELSKPTGLVPGGDRDGALVGYTVCSRYDTRLARHERRRRARSIAATGSPRRCWPSSTDAPATTARSSRSRCARSNQGAIDLYQRDGFRIAGLRRRYYQDNGEDALIMWRTPATLGGSPRRRSRGRPRRPPPPVILALETSCDDTCAALVGRDGAIRANVDLLAGGARALRRRRPRDRGAPPSSI